MESGERVTLESFDSLTSYWLGCRNSPMWNCLFGLPPWLEVWWREMASGGELYLGVVRQRGVIIGIAPLLLKGAEASFIGSTNVCDYMDFIIVPGKELDFFHILLDDLRGRGIRRLDLELLRPDSTVLTHLRDIAQREKYGVSCEEEDVSLEMELPRTWEGYLGTLTQKQRHEVRRKLRRLREAGKVSYRVIEESDSALQASLIFFAHFRESRQDKAMFLTVRMESFFRSLIKAMGRARLLRFGILELDALPVASLICFDYNNTLFLYNNGYDPRYSSLGVGQVSKVFCIKDSIETGRGKFDFLKGMEEYKYRLGGQEVNLYSCQISLG